jgi:hypothetical protein
MELRKRLKYAGKVAIATLVPIGSLGISLQRVHASATLPLDGSVVQGVIASGDLVLNLNQAFTDKYSFEGHKGTEIAIAMSSRDLDSRLFLSDSTGKVLADNDDGAGGKNSWLKVSLPEDGTYTIYASTYKGGDQGVYHISATTLGCDSRAAGSLVPSSAPVVASLESKASDGTRVAPSESETSEKTREIIPGTLRGQSSSAEPLFDQPNSRNNDYDNYVRVTNYASSPEYSLMQVPMKVPNVTTSAVSLQGDQIDLNVGSADGFWEGAAFRVGDERGFCSATVMLRDVRETSSSGVVLRGIGLSGMSAEIISLSKSSEEGHTSQAVSLPEEYRVFQAINYSAMAFQAINDIDYSDGIPVSEWIRNQQIKTEPAPIPSITPLPENNSQHEGSHRSFLSRIIDWFKGR